MTTPQEKAAAARKAAEDAARVAAEAMAAAEAAEQEAAAASAAPATDSRPAAEGSESDSASEESASKPAASGAAAQIAEGYAFSGPALELGTVMVDGVADPDARVRIPLRMMNRHGLVAGATGTGKTKTLQGIAEHLSRAGTVGSPSRAGAGAPGGLARGGGGQSTPWPRHPPRRVRIPPPTAVIAPRLLPRAGRYCGSRAPGCAS
ncbi:helicase HerA-like domain-containing protein, partial [Nocardia sp. NPDC060220]|uniref:helicase HerA-like domain-containing protein n=1 Tax=Nocardia sp. NPDC060220 TaxID=3347076 RepID=UPI00364B14FD